MPVFTCTCKHKAQDKFHGKGKRVFNGMRRLGGSYDYRCSVCGRVVSKSQPYGSYHLGGLTEEEM